MSYANYDFGFDPPTLLFVPLFLAALIVSNEHCCKKNSLPGFQNYDALASLCLWLYWWGLPNTYEPRCEKMAFCLCENKDADQLRS